MQKRKEVSIVASDQAPMQALAALPLAVHTMAMTGSTISSHVIGHTYSSGWSSSSADWRIHVLSLCQYRIWDAAVRVTLKCADRRFGIDSSRCSHVPPGVETVTVTCVVLSLLDSANRSLAVVFAGRCSASGRLEATFSGPSPAMHESTRLVRHWRMTNLPKAQRQ
jgi:hypothetical protein